MNRVKKVVLKIKPSKHKSQIRISRKPRGFSKNALSKTFFYLVNNRFCLKRLRTILQKLRIALFGQFWLKLPVFSIFDPLKKCFRQSLRSKKFAEYSEGTDMF